MGKIIAIDFDGTLCESQWPEIGAPKHDVIRNALKAQRDGAKLILWTCRTGNLLDAAVNWCHAQGLHFDAVNANTPEAANLYGGESRKVLADEYWDDKAVPPSAPSCESCAARKETRPSKHRLYLWCANSCKNYNPR